MTKPSGGTLGEALLVCPEAPYPITGGGAIRTASLLEYLGARYSLDVIMFRESGAPDPRAAFPRGLVRSISTIELPHHRRGFGARAARNASRCLGARPPLNDRFAGFNAAIQRSIAGRAYDLAVIEHFWCAPYIDAIAPCAACVLLDLHNIESALYASYAAMEWWPLCAMFRRFARACERMERQWLPCFSGVLTASEEDARRVCALAPGAGVHVYPNALPLTPQPDVSEENAIAFSGNFEYKPNLGAVRFFRRDIWPVLRSRHPGLVWRLIGKNGAAVRRFTSGDPRIEVCGEVDDAVAALARSRVVVVPLLAGSGTRLKILEAWAAGRPVVSTGVGAEGLAARDGQHLLIADTPGAFAAAVSHLLDSPEARARIGSAGRCLYEQRFTWARAWRALEFLGKDRSVML